MTSFPQYQCFSILISKAMASTHQEDGDLAFFGRLGYLREIAELRATRNEGIHGRFKPAYLIRRDRSNAQQHSEVYFSPGGGIQNQIIRRVNQARSTIDIAMYSFTSGAEPI